jgi:hypothetical protein
LSEGLAKTIDYFDKKLSKEGTSALARRRIKLASI